MKFTQRATPNEQAYDSLQDQVALVVGGSRGIGLAIAQELERAGCEVVVASRTAARSLANTTITGFDCDVRHKDSVEALFEDVIERLGRVDIVVHSAGIGRSDDARLIPAATVSLSDKDWDDVMDTNLRGVFHVARSAGRWMTRRRSGQILNISSARGARRGLPFAAAYCSAKMAALAMYQALAEELRPFGVRVWSLLPDAVATGLIANTQLAKRGSLSAARLAALIVHFLSLPYDTQLMDPVVEPFEFCAGGFG